MGLSLVFVIYESANPHMGKAYPIFQVFLVGLLHSPHIPHILLSDRDNYSSPSHKLIIYGHFSHILFLQSKLYWWGILFVIAAVLGRLPGTTVYRNVMQYPDAYIYHGVVILRIDSPIYFANINFIKERWVQSPRTPFLMNTKSWSTCWCLHIVNRLREFEIHTGVQANRGHDVGNIRFLIIEMSRKLSYLAFWPKFWVPAQVILPEDLWFSTT